MKRQIENRFSIVGYYHMDLPNLIFYGNPPSELGDLPIPPMVPQNCYNYLIYNWVSLLFDTIRADLDPQGGMGRSPNSLGGFP